MSGSIDWLLMSRVMSYLGAQSSTLWLKDAQ